MVFDTVSHLNLNQPVHLKLVIGTRPPTRIELSSGPQSSCNLHQTPVLESAEGISVKL